MGFLLAPLGTLQIRAAIRILVHDHFHSNRPSPRARGLEMRKREDKSELPRQPGMFLLLHICPVYPALRVGTPVSITDFHSHHESCMKGLAVTPILRGTSICLKGRGGLGRKSAFTRSRDKYESRLSTSTPTLPLLLVLLQWPHRHPRLSGCDPPCQRKLSTGIFSSTQLLVVLLGSSVPRHPQGTGLSFHACTDNTRRKLEFGDKM